MQKCRKIINLLLIISFLIILMIPTILFSIYKDKIPVDTSENRKLAEKPIFSLEEIATYSLNYEKYYNDNLPFRGIIRNIWTNFNIYILNECTTTQVLIGKNDGDISSSWLFYQDDSESTNPVKEAQGIEYFSKEEMTSIADTIEKNIQELNDRDIKLYYTLIPNKENLYKEKLPENFTIFEEKTRVDKLAEYIKEDRKIENVMYLKDALEKEKENNQIYYKQDTHWNNYGAFIGFKEIMSNINDSYSNFEHKLNVSEEKLVEQDLAKMSGIKDVFKDKEITVEFLPDATYEQTVLETATLIHITENEEAPIDETLLIVGDSFRVAMIPYFSKVYSKVIYMHRCDYANYVLEAYAPDVIVCQFLERYGNTIKDFNLY